MIPAKEHSRTVQELLSGFPRKSRLTRDKYDFTVESNINKAFHRPKDPHRWRLCMIRETEEDEDENNSLAIIDNKESPSDAPPINLNSSATNSNKPIADTIPPSFPFLPAAVATLAFVLLWPLLAFLRNSYFDVDMFMALKGILDAPPSMDDTTSNIVELPPLSPAERLVDAIFGPP
jgi:hypothetical protein